MMQVGDLVMLSYNYSHASVVQDWGFGLIVSEDVPGGNQVKVIWPQKSGKMSTLLKSRMEVVNEGR